MSSLDGLNSNIPRSLPMGVKVAAGISGTALGVSTVVMTVFFVIFPHLGSVGVAALTTAEGLTFITFAVSLYFLSKKQNERLEGIQGQLQRNDAGLRGVEEAPVEADREVEPERMQHLHDRCESLESPTNNQVSLEQTLPRLNELIEVLHHQTSTPTRATNEVPESDEEENELLPPTGNVAEESRIEENESKGKEEIPETNNFKKGITNSEEAPVDRVLPKSEEERLSQSVIEKILEQDGRGEEEGDFGFHSVNNSNASQAVIPFPKNKFIK